MSYRIIVSGQRVLASRLALEKLSPNSGAVLACRSRIGEPMYSTAAPLKGDTAVQGGSIYPDPDGLKRHLVAKKNPDFIHRDEEEEKDRIALLRYQENQPKRRGPPVWMLLFGIYITVVVSLSLYLKNEKPAELKKQDTHH